MFFFDFLILLVFFCCMGCERTTEKIIRDLNCKSAIETENGKTMDEELSEEELLHFNKMFFTQSQEENPYVRCLTSLYHDPKDMNIFLAFYGGSDSAKVTDENERERVMGAYNQEGTLLKISKTKMNEFLMRYIGLPVDETNKNGIELFEYDSGNYYYQTDFYPESRLSTTFLRGEHTDNKVRLYYRVLQSVCGIQRGSQPYSHMKKAELVLKGYVSESSSTQLTSLNIAINGGLAMGHYWKGRLLLEQAKQDHDRCNDYKDAAIASFCATNVTERFDHLPENADEDAAPQLSPPQWLSAIELLRYPDRAVFRVDRRMVFQTIYQKLTQQVEEVQSDNIQIHNERYRLTKKDVRSNLERCLDMVKAQFPDKEPLIQKMIRSIR